MPSFEMYHVLGSGKHDGMALKPGRFRCPTPAPNQRRWGSHPHQLTSAEAGLAMAAAMHWTAWAEDNPNPHMQSYSSLAKSLRSQDLAVRSQHMERAAQPLSSCSSLPSLSLGGGVRTPSEPRLHTPLSDLRGPLPGSGSVRKSVSFRQRSALPGPSKACVPSLWIEPAGHRPGEQHAFVKQLGC